MSASQHNMHSKPKIELLAPPFAGHLHPILAIGRALTSSADITVVSTEAAQSRIHAAGLQGVAVVPGADAALREITDPPHPIRTNPFRLQAQLQRSLALQAAFASALHARYRNHRPDLLIADFTLAVAGPVAQTHEVPWWTSHPSPCVIEAPGGPPAYLGGWQPGRHLFGTLRDAVAASIVRGFKSGVHRLHRRSMQELGFPALYRADRSEAAYSPECILALGLRELEFERAWPSSVRFVGPMLWSPPSHGSAYSGDASKPQILATLGTHLGWAKDALSQQLDAIAQRHLDWHLHFSDGGFNDSAFDNTTTSSLRHLQRHRWIDYPHWIPQMQAVLHHGGAGVMWECLRAGIPALVLPTDYDQFDHAARLEASGVAIRIRRPGDIEAALIRVLEGNAGLHADRFVDALRPGLAEARIVEAVRMRLRI